MKVRLFAIDLDGTALNSNGLLSQENYQAILKAIESGIEIVVATGRRIDGLPKEIDTLPIRYFVTKNGAVIYDKKEKKELYHQYFDKQKVLEVVKYLSNTRGIINVEDKYHHYISKKYLSNKADFYQEHLYDTVILVDDVYNEIKDLDLQVDKINYLALDEETFENIYKQENMPEGMDIAQTFTLFVDINESSCSKGGGIERLCQLININQKHVAAIGDNDNDISMLSFANYSFAVDNATERLKKQANIIVSCNNDNGLAEAINKVIEFNKEGE